MTFDYETMRRDVADALFIQPDDIGENDNLADLGLDSMRIMTLVMGWQERGLNVDFVNFAEVQTLAAWRAAFEGRDATA